MGMANQFRGDLFNVVGNQGQQAEAKQQHQQTFSGFNDRDAAYADRAA